MRIVASTTQQRAAATVGREEEEAADASQACGMRLRSKAKPEPATRGDKKDDKNRFDAGREMKRRRQVTQGEGEGGIGAAGP